MIQTRPWYTETNDLLFEYWGWILQGNSQVEMTFSGTIKKLKII